MMNRNMEYRWNGLSDDHDVSFAESNAVSADNYLKNIHGTVYLIVYNVHFSSLRSKLIHGIVDLAGSNCIRLTDNVCLMATNISLDIIHDKLQSLIESSDMLIVTPLLKSASLPAIGGIHDFIINGKVDKPMK